MCLDVTWDEGDDIAFSYSFYLLTCTNNNNDKLCLHDDINYYSIAKASEES